MAKVKMGTITVMTPTREMLIDEWAALCTNRIISVSQDLPEHIRSQAIEYRDQIGNVVLHYMKECIRSDRASLAHKLSICGHSDTASLVMEQ